MFYNSIVFVNVDKNTGLIAVRNKNRQSFFKSTEPEVEINKYIRKNYPLDENVKVIRIQLS